MNPNSGAALNHCVLQHSSAQRGSAVSEAKLGRNPKSYTIYNTQPIGGTSHGLLRSDTDTKSTPKSIKMITCGVLSVEKLYMPMSACYFDSCFLGGMVGRVGLARDYVMSKFHLATRSMTGKEGLLRSKLFSARYFYAKIDLCKV